MSDQLFWLDAATFDDPHQHRNSVGIDQSGAQGDVLDPQVLQLELAAYFADQPFESTDQKVDADLANMGAQIHEQSCEKCHSDGDSLVLDDAGILAGQWKGYLISTLQDYKNGDRWQPEKMQPATNALSEKDIKALAEYYAREGKKIG